MDKKLLEAIARLIKKQISEEVAKQTELIRAQIISEVAGMLNYSERKLLSKMNEGESVRQVSERGMRQVERESDFERSMKNVRTMDAYKDVVGKVNTPKRTKSYTSNPLLNELLNETDEMGRDEYSSSPSVMDMMGNDDVEDTYEPWSNEDKIRVPQPSQRATQPVATPKSILGTDNRPVDLQSESVKKVMQILNTTDFKAKYDEIAEMGNNFRDGGVQAPRYNSDYFKKTMVE